jgi:hypothetical protein
MAPYRASGQSIIILVTLEDRLGDHAIEATSDRRGIAGSSDSNFDRFASD